MHLSEAELRSVGCAHCVHRMMGHCFHDLPEPEEYNRGKYKGYCPELVDWLFALSGDTESASVVWERYHLFVAQLQSHKDFSEYQSVSKELLELESRFTNELSPSDIDRMKLLRMKQVAFRAWWDRINDTILKHLGKINDRASRSENVDKMTAALPLSQLHQIIVNRKEVLEDRS